MKRKQYIVPFAALIVAFFIAASCSKNLDTLPENRTFTAATDYSKTSDMILPLLGLYERVQPVDVEWPDIPLISVRGDDVNAGGLGDQIPFDATDKFSYDATYWMYNALWSDYTEHVLTANSTMEQIALYKAQASGNSAALADQYTAEAKVLRGWWLFHLSRVWGAYIIPVSSDPAALYNTPLSTKDQVMQHISDQMDEAIPLLPDMRPNQRTDIPGGITKYTALAIKALANLELKNYQKVADATGEIINSGKYTLEPDYYNLFKLKGKLNNENLFERQYSDFGKGSGDNYYYLYAFYGPQVWNPKVPGVSGGWSFWEPSQKYIKFMLDRGDTMRLKTTVIFTPRGIDALKADPAYAQKITAAGISTTTRSGDEFVNIEREMFLSGKHYLPSDQLTPGRIDYGTNKNFTMIRYAQMLLMYAEALTQGASGTAGTADNAINLIRARAGMPALTGVTNDQVMDEKFAELALEFGDRFYDMIRLGKYNELSYDGRIFTPDKTFLPYPQAQVDLLPALKGK